MYSEHRAPPSNPFGNFCFTITQVHLPMSKGKGLHSKDLKNTKSPHITTSYNTKKKKKRKRKPKQTYSTVWTKRKQGVTSSLSRPHHHKGRIPQWAQESPSSPYVRRGNVLEPCGDFFDQSYVEGSRRLWRSLHNCRRCWKCPHLCRRVWNNVEEYGRPWNMGEYSRNFNGSLVTTCT